MMHFEPAKKNNEKSPKELINDCIKTLEAVKALLEGKEGKLTTEENHYDDIFSKRRLTLTEEEKNVLITQKKMAISAVKDLIDESLGDIRSYKARTVPRDMNEVKELLNTNLSRITNGINSIKNEKPAWLEIQKHRGILGIIDKILQAILGEKGRIKTATERTIDNAASTTDKARPR